MAQLNQESIKNLIALSRIDCSEEEQQKLFVDLKKILDYIALLDEIDTTNVSVRNQVIEGAANVMREDTVGTTMPRETFLANAPSQVGGMIRVPPVIKQQ